jgi:hypothetical protein
MEKPPHLKFLVIIVSSYLDGSEMVVTCQTGRLSLSRQTDSGISKFHTSKASLSQ